MKQACIAVLIPCFNEAQTIEKVVKDFHKELPRAEIYVYDNNSTDNTDKIAEKAGAIVRYEYQQGKGNVIRRMFREIEADCYILVDGDDTYPAANSARKMADEVINKHIDMVIGDRLSSTYFQENNRAFHGFGNKIVRKLINLIFKSDIKDIMTGYRAFSYNFVKTFPVLSRGFEIETEMTIHAIDKNMLIENCIIQYQDRPKGSQSKLNTFSDGIKILWTIFKLFRIYKPLSFWGLVSFFLFVLAFGFLVPVLFEYFKTGLVERFPTLIVCCFTVVAAIQAFFTGMILQTIRHKNRQDFEVSLQQINRLKEIK